MAKRGRKKYAGLMAQVIAEKTGDGAEIVETAFKIMREGETDRDRLAAAVFLKETLAGKAPLVVEVEETDPLSSLDVDELSDAQLAELSTTLRKVLEHSEPDAPAVLVAESSTPRSLVAHLLSPEPDVVPASDPPSE